MRIARTKQPFSGSVLFLCSLLKGTLSRVLLDHSTPRITGHFLNIRVRISQRTSGNPIAPAG